MKRASVFKSNCFFSEHAIFRSAICKIVVVLIIGVVFTACNQSKATKSTENTDLTIFAAAGTRLATDKIVDLYESSADIKVHRNYASSGILARQIANGAPCNVFISANKQWIDFLLEQGLLKDGSVRKIGGNSLVLIAPKNATTEAPKFSDDFDIVTNITGRIAIGDPAYVPVGKYSKMVLDSLKWYDKIKDKMILAKDVSSVLHYVELGECDWGIVYKTEVLNSQRVKIIGEIPASLHPEIVFYIADVKAKNQKGEPLSAMFLSCDGTTILDQYGFKSLQSDVSSLAENK